MTRIDTTHRALRADGLLLLTAVIWGFAFVAQRMGMEHVGPFGFNGVRFALGCLVLLPLILRRAPAGRIDPPSPPVRGGGLLAGLVLFCGASFQQVALVYTTAGKAGFITGLYVVLVPVLGAALGQRTHAGAWTGALLAAAGLYLLSVTEQLAFAPGDLLVLIGAGFWAVHVLLIGWLSPRQDPLRLAFAQYAVCSLLSLLASAALEPNALDGYRAAALPILYGGVLSVGVAYTLQVVAQQEAKPAHAAILLSLETVFAALGGWLVLGETLSPRGLVGCALMFAGMLVSQLWRIPRSETPGGAGC
ncbi:MAG: DMT family transporter [Candidatus Methylomirabilota bacterium]